MSRESEALRKAAAWYRRHAFSPWHCGCFLRAIGEISPGKFILLDTLREVIGTNFGQFSLHRHGWTEGCTDDAVAALLIAADLAE